MSHKIGILGTGHIAHKMASTIAQMDGYENYAVASRSQDKACQFAAQYTKDSMLCAVSVPAPSQLPLSARCLHRR